MKLLRQNPRASSSALAAILGVALLLAADARADGVAAKPAAPGGPETPGAVVGKAPTATPDAPPTNEASAAPVFDAAELGEPDKATMALVKTVEERCYAEPRSREGMTPSEERRCNLAVSRLSSKGTRAVPAILAALNASDDAHYYARTRLYHALGKSDDPRVEDVLLRGYARIATRKLDAFTSDTSMIEDALVTMNAADPAGAAAIGKKEITDQWASAEDRVLTWRVFQRDHASTSKADLRKEGLKKARADVKSKDLRVAYLAMTTLAELAPSEGLAAANALLEREDLTPDDKSPFYIITSRAYDNGAVERDEPEPPPKPAPKMKTKTSKKGKARSRK